MIDLNLPVPAQQSVDRVAKGHVLARSKPRNMDLVEIGMRKLVTLLVQPPHQFIGRLVLGLGVCHQHGATFAVPNQLLGIKIAPTCLDEIAGIAGLSSLVTDDVFLQAGTILQGHRLQILGPLNVKRCS